MMGLFMEEIELGERIALGTHMFTVDAIKRYALQFDPAPFHLDEEAGRASFFGAMTAASLHVAAGWMACFVETNTRAREARAAKGLVLPEIGPSPGFTKMRWLKPVFAGDTLSYFTTPRSARTLASRPGWGLVNSTNVGLNQRGEQVFVFEGAVMTACRLS